jgi:hypothetical protein
MSIQVRDSSESYPKVQSSKREWIDVEKRIGREREQSAEI